MYAGNMANPHGFTVATIPALKAYANKPTFMEKPPSNLQSLISSLLLPEIGD